MAEKRTGLALSNDLCTKLSQLCEELYNEMPWKHAIAGVIFAAAEFAYTASEQESEPSYHDRAILLADQFKVRADCPPRVRQGLDCVLHCMDCAHIDPTKYSDDHSPSKEQMLVSVHGYVPAKQAVKAPQVPNTPGIYQELTAMLVFCPCTAELLEVVPCFRGWPLLHESHWKRRLLLVQVGRIAETADNTETPQNESDEHEVKKQKSSSVANSSSSNSSSSTSHTTSPDTSSPIPCKPPPPPPKPSSRQTQKPSNVSSPVKKTTSVMSPPPSAHTNKAQPSDELLQLYNVYNALTSKGIRIESAAGRMHYAVPENLPVLQCSCCQQKASEADMKRLQQHSADLKNGLSAQLATQPNDFLGCEHYTHAHQEATLQAWERAAQKVVLEHDMSSIKRKHSVFLNNYNLADNGLNSFMKITDPADYEANCEAVRNCAKWQRGKNASYPTYTFVLVDVPLKGEDLNAKRRVKSGSSACPWNKVIVNMEVPSEAMVQSNTTSAECLAARCPVYKVPLNQGIEDHMQKLRSVGRVRSKKINS